MVQQICYALYLIDAGIEENKQNKRNDSENNQSTPIQVGCVNGITSHFSWFQSNDFFRQIVVVMVNVANVSLKKSCKSKQEREKYDGKNVFEYSFCQCVGLMHGLTEIEKKIMSFRTFVIPNNSLLQVLPNPRGKMIIGHQRGPYLRVVILQM